MQLPMRRREFIEMFGRWSAAAGLNSMPVSAFSLMGYSDKAYAATTPPAPTAAVGTDLLSGPDRARRVRQPMITTLSIVESQPVWCGSDCPSTGLVTNL